MLSWAPVGALPFWERRGLHVGAWRSPVAHLHGVQGVGGSNPLAPTILPPLAHVYS